FVWVFVAGGWAMGRQVGGRRATGIVLGGIGAGLAVPSLVIGLVGFETAITAWNDQMGLLPGGLSRILGITVHLGIPQSTPWVLCAVGAALFVIGAALSWKWRRPATL